MTVENGREQGTSARSSVFPVVRFLFGAVGLAFAVVAIFRTSGDLGDWSGVTFGAVSAAAVLIATTTAMAARGWESILSATSDARHRQAYYSALIGKYIPGGFFQAAGQVTLASRSGLGLRRAFSRYVISMLVALAAGLIAGVGVVADPAFSLPVRLVVALGVVAGFWLVPFNALPQLAGWIGRVLRRPLISDGIPGRRQLHNALGWNLAGLLTMAAAFAILLSTLSEATPSPTAASAFLVAWLVGLVAVPFPAGIGVREATLVWLLAPTESAGLMVTASLFHRFVTLVVEVAIFVGSRLRGRET